MDDQKKQDNNFELRTVADCRDADNGYCVYFEDAKSVHIPDPRDKEGKLKMKVELTYWLQKSYNVVPRPVTRKEKLVIPADICRVYGKLGLGNQGVYGLDIIREDYEDGRLKKKVIEVFYNAPTVPEKPNPKNQPEVSKDEEVRKLKKRLAELETA